MQHAPAPPAPRAFGAPTGLGPDGLLLGLAPALTAQGIDRSPSFFSGFATEPLVLARGLLVLADITATRYFQYVPTTMRDPVLTANGDRLRAECFSACNSVYARLDLLGDGFDGGDIAHGTTNVDLGQQSRAVLSGVRRAELLHLDVGSGGAVLATPSAQAAERPVNMPDRWVRAFGNVAELHARMAPLVTLTAQEARAFVSAVPPATASGRTAWLAPTAAGTRIASRPTTGAIAVPGLHRLSAAKRLLPHLRGATVYGAPHAETGAVAVVLELPHARLTLGLTAEAWRGHSGEGALLAALAGDDVVADAEVVSALLAFVPVLDADSLHTRQGSRGPARTGRSRCSPPPAGSGGISRTTRTSIGSCRTIRRGSSATVRASPRPERSWPRVGWRRARVRRARGSLEAGSCGAANPATTPATVWCVSATTGSSCAAARGVFVTAQGAAPASTRLPSGSCEPARPSTPVSAPQH